CSSNLDAISLAPEQVKGHLLLMLCEAGALQVTIDEQTCSLSEGDMFICMPQCLLGHYMRTPDFRAKVICAGEHLYDEVLNTCLPKEPNWWQKQCYVLHHPVVRLTPYQRELFNSYYQLLQTFLADPAPKQELLKLRLGVAQSAAFEFLQSLNSKIQDPQDLPLPSLQMEGERLVSMDEGNFMHSSSAGGVGGGSGSRRGAGGSSSDVLFQSFMQLLSRHAATQREVAWYAQQILITPKHLNLVCKRISQRTASEWITEYTLKHIRYYLFHTNMSIKEIAFQMSFSDVSFFCKYTRRYLGTSPQHLREQERLNGLLDR
ncbi:MAG: helix-turn-helix domain-containing protein, partial [Paludibacteraceae bacterium]